MVAKLILQMDPEVHVLNGVDHDVDELHARHLVDINSRRWHGTLWEDYARVISMVYINGDKLTSTKT